jgi:hypothetical protein
MESFKWKDVLIQPDYMWSFIRNKLAIPKNISYKDSKEIKSATETILNNLTHINKELELENRSLLIYLNSLHKNENSSSGSFNFSKLREILINPKIQTSNTIEKTDKVSNSDIKLKFQTINNESILIPSSLELNITQTPLHINDVKVNETCEKLKNVNLEKQNLLNEEKIWSWKIFIFGR